jgi:hypothetical protein
MTDALSFSTLLSGATAPALRVARDRIQHARIQHPAERSAANALLKQIAQELAARGVYRRPAR